MIVKSKMNLRPSLLFVRDRYRLIGSILNGN